MKHNTKLCFSLIVFIFISCSKEKIKIACVGESMTEGYGLACQGKTAYPVLFDCILVPVFSWLNCGRSATILQKKGDFPYWIFKEFYDEFAFNPDIIIIKLGTNDTKSQTWNAENFTKNYQVLVDTFGTIPGKPQISVCLPVPAYKTVWGINDSTITAGVIPAIEKIDKANNLQVIDLYHPMGNQPENFPDGIHPDENRIKIMAGIITGALK